MPLIGVNIWGDAGTRLRAPRMRDDTGTLMPQRDWDNATQTPFAGLSVQPKATTQTGTAAGFETTTEWVIYSQPGVILDLQAGDRFRWQGVDYDVVGQPQSWPRHHSEVTIRRAPMTRLDATGADAVLRQSMTTAMPNQQIYEP